MNAKVLFLDLETTGLNPETTTILEVAAVAVGAGFEEVASFERVVHHDLPPMDEWCRKTHGESGLLAAVAESTFSLREVETDLANFARKVFPGGKIILAGNSIHFDRGYVKKHLPRLEAMLHYRMLDVTAVRQAREFFSSKPVPDVGNERPHRAMPDVRASIAMLKGLVST